MIPVDACTWTAIACGRCAKIPRQKYPGEQRVISAGGSDYQYDDWSEFFHRAHPDNWQAHLRWLAIHRAEWANLQHAQRFPEPNRMRRKRSIPKAETNVRRSLQTMRALVR